MTNRSSKAKEHRKQKKYYKKNFRTDAQGECTVNEKKITHTSHIAINIQSSMKSESQQLLEGENLSQTNE